MNAYFRAISQYVSFKGRMSRADYWYFILTVVVLGSVGVFVDYALGHRLFALGRLGLSTLIILAAHFLPFVAASVRRIHDSDQSGWLYWLIYIPLLGWIPFLGLMLARGTDGANRYGEPETQDVGEPLVFGSYQQVPTHFEPVAQMPIAVRAANATVPNAALRPVAAQPVGEMNLIGQLERLSALRAGGSLTDEEFEALKGRIMLESQR